MKTQQAIYWLNLATSLLVALAVLAGLVYGAVLGVEWAWAHLQPHLALAWDRAQGWGAYFLWEARVWGSTLYALDFATRMDRLYDALPDKPIPIRDGGYITEEVFPQWEVLTNSRDLELVAEDVLPYFGYEFGWYTIRPYGIAFVPFQGPAAFHVLGRASCEYSIAIFNFRYANPLSTLYQHDSLLPTIVHELGHVQGVCTWLPWQVAEMEAANQVATWEVLAAMANHGNAYAVKPLAAELRDAALSYARSVMRERKVEGLYDWYVRTFLLTTLEEQSKRDKARRFWEQDPETLDYILKAYGRKPWEMLTAGLAHPRHEVASIHYPNWQLLLAPRWEGNYEVTIRVDDLDYFLRHLETAWEVGRK